MAVVTLLRTLVRAGDADASAQANQNVNRARGYNFFSCSAQLSMEF